MPIEAITNGESGSSVRAKLNNVISATNSAPTEVRPIAYGGTGAETAAAARVNLGTETVVPGVAQVITLTIESTPSSEWAGLYIDIYDGTGVCRFWVSQSGSGDAPPTPPGGRLQLVNVTGFDIIDAETAFLAALSAQSSAFSATGSGTGLITVTNVFAAAAAAPAHSSPPLPIALSVSITGVDSYRQLPVMDASQLYNVNANFLPNPSASEKGGVIASEGSAGQYVKGLNTVGSLIYDALPTASTDVRLYTANATWDNPSPSIARRVFVRLVGGGGGGGSGRKGATLNTRCGGGGGAAGAVVEFWALTTDLNLTQSVTVGAGGTGGAAQTTNSTNGNNGTNGGNTTFAGTTALGGNDGIGGTTTAGTNSGGATTANSCVIGIDVANNSAGANSGVSGAVGFPAATATFFIPTGGGGGGGLNGSNTNTAGGAGGAIGAAGTIAVLAGGTGGASGGGNGGNGNAGRGVGTGGGGGGTNNATAGGNGGNGGGYGGGGGGGGAGTDDVGNSGAGGNGAQGYALVITY